MLHIVQQMKPISQKKSISKTSKVEVAVKSKARITTKLPACSSDISTGDVTSHCSNVKQAHNSGKDLAAAPPNYDNVSKTLRRAFQARDYQKVLHSWELLKGFDGVSHVQLCHVVE